MLPIVISNKINGLVAIHVIVLFTVQANKKAGKFHFLLGLFQLKIMNWDLVIGCSLWCAVPPDPASVRSARAAMYVGAHTN
jgi:hypothetical protein